MDGASEPLSVVAVDPDVLLERVRVEFGVHVTSVSETGAGHDTEAVVLRGMVDDGRSIAIKLSCGGSPAGVFAAHLVTEQGVAGVPAPLLARSGLPFSSAGGLRMSVTPWLLGRSGASAPMSAQQWRSFGTLLARVHDAPVPAGVSAHLPTEDFETSIAGELRSLHEEIGQAAARCGVAGGPTVGQHRDDALTRTLARHWLGTADALMAIAEQVEALGAELRPRPAPRVLCHGDAHAGNVLVGDNGNVWLLDWDSSFLAPRERDLMFVIGGVLADTPVTVDEQSWFFDGYGQTEIDPTRLAYYQCSRALEDTVGWAAQVLNPQVAQPERSEALDIFEGLLSPTGIVERACASLRG